MKAVLVILIAVIIVGCVTRPQPSSGVPAQVLATPITGYTGSRPGWTYVKYPSEYRAQGTNLVQQLMMHLKVKQAGEDSVYPPFATPVWCNGRPDITKRDALLMLTAELASDLKATNAIPFLVVELGRIIPDDDTMVGQCLIAKLVELTHIENGPDYYRHWWRKKVQTSALQSLKEWMKNNGF